MFQKFDRRALIFFTFSLIAVVLLIPCPEKFHKIGETLAAVYFLLGLGSLLDDRARKRSRKRT